ncbi:MAG: hypothetical protein QM752_07340 [Gammaproteobacteria bacterium]
MLNQEEVAVRNPRPHFCYPKRICWGAIIAGALVGFGLTFLLQIFDKAIGITVYNTGSSGAEALVVGGFLGSILGIITSMFFTGWVAGYLSRSYFFDRRIGALYGLLAWCLALLIGMLFMGHMAFQGADTQSRYNAHFSSVPLNTDQTASVITDETSKSNSTSSGVNVDAKQASLSLFLTFLLFFIGAVSASVGGYVGLRAEKRTDATTPIV